VNVKKIWQVMFHQQPVSLEYRQWRDHLIRHRFWLAIGLAILYVSIRGVAAFYEIFINPEQLLRSLERNNLTYLLEAIHRNFFLHKVAFISLLGCLILVWRSAWGLKHPEIMLVLMPWAIAFIPEMILSGYLGFPGYPSKIMFMAQAVIIPIHWRLHLLAQIVPVAFYLLIYPLLGLATLGGRSIYSFSDTVEIILVCIICETGVYLYEQSKQSELEANRRLQLCIHSITHDLRTPVIGSLLLLESIRQSSSANLSIEISQTEMAQLIQGSNRLLGLMNSLLIPQAFSQADLVLSRQPVNLTPLITSILQDFQPSFAKQSIEINNRIQVNLPLVDIDAQQIGRVFNNLISNAITHNPSGILLTLDAVRSGSMLKIIVQDNGVGVPPDQQETVFDPYARGRQTQYLPGLGLGLYICRQIILAHGGIIGFESPDQGTVIWFTLPLSGV
jgi:signal transduction histidine kinase